MTIKPKHYEGAAAIILRGLLYVAIGAVTAPLDWDRWITLTFLLIILSLLTSFGPRLP